MADTSGSHLVVTYEVEECVSAAQFVQQTLAFRSELPYQTNQIGSAAMAYAKRTDAIVERCLWWILREQSSRSVVGVAIRNGERPMLMSPMPEAAARLLAEHAVLKDPELSSVSGPKNCINSFLSRLGEVSPCGLCLPTLLLETTAYQLDTLCPPTEAAPGRARQATLDEFDTVYELFALFIVEAKLGTSVDLAAIVRSRLSDGLVWVWETVAGEIAAFGGHSLLVECPPLGLLARVGPMYSCERFRRKGYAAALTAFMCELLQAKGASVMLFADTGNAASNALYRKLGFKQVGHESVEYTLTWKDGNILTDAHGQAESGEQEVRGDRRPEVPRLGPEPVLISRKEVDMLYEILQDVSAALTKLGIDYIVTGGSLLGAVRQHSILFCDDDIDIAIIDRDGSCYDRATEGLQSLLRADFRYIRRPWEGGDKVRSVSMPTVFLDLFTIQRFESMEALEQIIGVKKNGKSQSAEYVEGIISKIQTSAFSQGETGPLFPLWHFNTRKAIEMWPKEVYREYEMFPLIDDLKFGPLTGIKGPKTPVLLLKRAFGLDCFDVYFQSGSHKNMARPSFESKESNAEEQLRPLVLEGGAWEGGRRVALEPEHYKPMQPSSRVKRRPTLHGRESLMEYLTVQTDKEYNWVKQWAPSPSETAASTHKSDDERIGRTVYMDGVFDLFHIGHLEAIRNCAALGDKVIIGVTGDVDAAGYKRPPIISQPNRVAVVEAIREVAYVVCPCPLVVTEQFMAEHKIDLVVHGYASDADADRQREFFEIPMRIGKFKRIPYYEGLSTTDIINKIQRLPTTS